MTDTLKEAAQDKFRRGLDMTYDELCQLEMVDRCRYVVTKYFPNGFSAGEVASKLNSLHPQPDLHYTPMEVHEALVQFYGQPDQRGGMD